MRGRLSPLLIRKRNWKNGVCIYHIISKINCMKKRGAEYFANILQTGHTGQDIGGALGDRQRGE
jgi:hypothetical protein